MHIVLRRPLAAHTPIAAGTAYPIDDNAQVTTKANPDDVIKEGNSIIASMKDFKNKHKRGIKMAATSVAIGAGATIGWKFLKSKLNKLKDQSEVIDSGLEEIQRLMLFNFQ